MAGDPSTPSRSIASGVDASLYSASVARFTETSVACADSTTATSNVNGSTNASSLRGAGLALAKASMKPRTSSRVMARGLRGLDRTEVDCFGIHRLVARTPACGKGVTGREGVTGRRLRYMWPMDRDATQFEAMIVPHRSLSPRALSVLMGVIGGLCGLIMLRFWLIGAWPVAGFGLVEVGLAIFLLRLNAHRARASELILLSERALRIVRTDRHGRRQERELPAGWLNAVMEEPPGRVPRLLLVARGVREEIAVTLGEAEKRDLWMALRDALHRLRHPNFDNPQLRDLPVSSPTDPST